MNYCILNGIDSRSINGLLIQSLPPIVKPLQRTIIEEIDGRDGDIITPLGFAAYDGEMTIGLHKDYNINEIISFFNSEGLATFSNEPDKYYKYNILNQIDFERLIRFKTATVTFHKQPFKYLVDEEQLEFDTSELDEVVVENVGNYFSKPTITLTGSGIINLSLNDYQLFAVDLSNDGYITIDADAVEAYAGGELKNRLVTGDIENLKLQTGNNVFTWSGELTELSVSNYTRWI